MDIDAKVKELTEWCVAMAKEIDKSAYTDGVYSHCHFCYRYRGKGHEEGCPVLLAREFLSEKKSRE